MKVFIYNDHNNEYHKEILNKTFVISLLLVVGFVGWKLLTAEKLTLAKEKYTFSGACPNNTDGYVNKTNILLQNCINKSNIKQIDLDSLVSNASSEIFFLGDSCLVFYLPLGGELSDLRLVGINKFYSAEDSLFFYNSLLPDHLKLQRKYGEKEFFSMTSSISSHRYVKKISIDENILAASLISDNSFWQSKVLANTDSLFSDFVFIRLADSWLPVGNYFKYNRGIPFNAINIPVDRTIDFAHPGDQFSLIKKSLIDSSRSFEISIDDKSFQVTKIGDTLYFYSTQLGDIEILRTSSTQTFPIRANDRIPIYIDKNPFEIKFKSGLTSNIGTIYCTKQNPFNSLSFMYFHNKYNSRHDVNKNEADLFSCILASRLPETENLFSELSGMHKVGDLKISYNPIVAKYLENEINDYRLTDAALTRERYTVDKMGVTLMNTSTGQVIAVPWFSRSDSGKTILKNLVNYNYFNHPIGSCFKPLLYMASYRRFPNLANLETNSDMVSSFEDFKKENFHNGAQVKILGYPTSHFAGHAKSGAENLVHAVAFSSNLYPAITFLYSLTENSLNPYYYDGICSGNSLPGVLYRSADDKHSVSCILDNNKLAIRGFNENQIAKIYENLFDIEGADIAKEEKDLYEYYYWNPNYCSNGNICANGKLLNYGALSPQKVTLRFDAFDGVHKTKGADFRGAVIPWILGSQNNRWNNVKLCEAFTRVITGVGVKGNFGSDSQRQSFKTMFELGKSIETIKLYPRIDDFALAHLSLIAALNNKHQMEVAKGSSWADIGKRLGTVHINGINSNLVMFAKTGTPDDDIEDDPADVIHRGLFTFTIMTEDEYQKLQYFIQHNYDPKLLPKKLGVTGVIAVELQNEQRIENGIYSRFAKNFLTQERLRAIVLLNKSCF